MARSPRSVLLTLQPALSIRTPVSKGNTARLFPTESLTFAYTVSVRSQINQVSSPEIYVVVYTSGSLRSRWGALHVETNKAVHSARSSGSTLAMLQPAAPGRCPECERHTPLCISTELLALVQCGRCPVTQVCSPVVHAVFSTALVSLVLAVHVSADQSWY